jgi:CDP-diglyceride synthetase
MNQPYNKVVKRPNRNGLIFILLISVIAGITSSEWYFINVSNKPFPDLVLNVLLGIGVLTWISRDIENFATIPSKWLSGFAIIFPIPTSFYYAFSRYGLKQGGILAIKIIGFILISFVTALIPIAALDYSL